MEYFSGTCSWWWIFSLLSVLYVHYKHLWVLPSICLNSKRTKACDPFSPNLFVLARDVFSYLMGEKTDKAGLNLTGNAKEESLIFAMQMIFYAFLRCLLGVYSLNGRCFKWAFAKLNWQTTLLFASSDNPSFCLPDWVPCRVPTIPLICIATLKNGMLGVESKDSWQNGPLQKKQHLMLGLSNWSNRLLFLFRYTGSSAFALPKDVLKEIT